MINSIRLIRFGLILIVGFTLRASYAQDTTRLSLLFLGDIMQHDSQIQAAFNPKTGKYDYSSCFSLMKPYFQDADLTIGNLELTLGGRPFTGYPQFSAPDELAVALKEAGVDILVTANNHSLDRRRKGLERTIRVLDSLGFQHTGTFRDMEERSSVYPLVVNKNGFRLSLLNYTYGTNGIPVTKPNVVNLIDTVQIRKDLIKAKEQDTDAIIVFMHWGDEYQSQPNLVQKQITSLCFKNGAKLVIGAHPHVLQPMEWYQDNNQLVAYSLGNFVSGQRPRYRDGGAMLSVDFVKVIHKEESKIIIENAAYRLQWVYKTADASRQFRVLPVAAIQSDPSRYIRDEASLQAFKLFADDSRKLLSKYNQLIGEETSVPSEKVTRYRIQLPLGVLAHATDSREFVYGIETINTKSENYCYAGNFKERQQAERYLQRLLPKWPQASVVTFVNDMPSSD
jgi:poly-gamma-glutamate synthesis protein (capsule biosynthesis protein)